MAVCGFLGLSGVNNPNQGRKNKGNKGSFSFQEKNKRAFYSTNREVVRLSVADTHALQGLAARN